MTADWASSGCNSAPAHRQEGEAADKQRQCGRGRNSDLGRGQKVGEIVEPVDTEQQAGIGNHRAEIIDLYTGETADGNRRDIESRGLQTSTLGVARPF